jgi:hypothetical protein
VIAAIDKVSPDDFLGGELLSAFLRGDDSPEAEAGAVLVATALRALIRKSFL